MQANDARRLETPRLRDPDVARDRQPTRVRQRRDSRPPAECGELKAQAQNTDAKLNAILKHLNIDAPPPTASAVAQQPV